MISAQEISLSKRAVQMAMEAGASASRITFEKNLTNMVSTVNGVIDKVMSSEDSSMSIVIFADSRFSSFSTNKLREDDLRAFIGRAVEMTRLMSKDECRSLPSPDRYCRTATNGREMDLYDPAFGTMDAMGRRETALRASVFPAPGLISEEGEYSDQENDILIVDSQGLECRHTVTSFGYSSEVTLQTEDGARYSGLWWDVRSRAAELDACAVGARAIELARAQIGASPVESGLYNMVVDCSVASKFVLPIFRALNGQSLQQNQSFLAGSLGKKIFSVNLTIKDLCHRKGELGSTLFDNEGVATAECPIIENGVVKTYFITTYISNKTGMAPTCDDAVRPVLRQYGAAGTAAEMMAALRDGIYVTGFNGGNCNDATGDFSYGVEGHLFKDGKIVRPISGMLVTGNLIDLWNKFSAAGSDALASRINVIPSLAFTNIDFNGI